jgi:hypothetical protein
LSSEYSPGFRRRPHQRHLLARQRQQGDDAFLASKPLVGDVMVRLLAGEIGDDGALVIGTVVDADVALAAHPGLAAVGAEQQLGLDGFDVRAVFQLDPGPERAAAQPAGAAGDDVDVLGEAQRGIQCGIQVAVLDDPGQRAGMGAEGVEAQVAAVLAVALHVHGVDRRHARHVECAPDLQRRQQLLRRMVERIHSDVPCAGCVFRTRARGRHQQGDAVPGLGKAQGGGLGDRAVADDADVATVLCGGRSLGSHEDIIALRHAGAWPG